MKMRTGRYNPNINSHLAKCPKCEKEFTFNDYFNINVTENPNLKDQVLNGSIFKAICPDCHEEFEFQHPFIYCDDKKRVIIHYDDAFNLLKAQYLDNTIPYQGKGENGYQHYGVSDMSSLVSLIHLIDMDLDIVAGMMGVLLMAVCNKEEKEIDISFDPRIVYSKKNNKYGVKYLIKGSDKPTIKDFDMDEYNKCLKTVNKYGNGYNYFFMNMSYIGKFINDTFSDDIDKLIELNPITLYFLEDEEGYQFLANIPQNNLVIDENNMDNKFIVLNHKTRYITHIVKGVSMNPFSLPIYPFDLSYIISEYKQYDIAPLLEHEPLNQKHIFNLSKMHKFYDLNLKSEISKIMHYPVVVSLNKDPNKKCPIKDTNLVNYSFAEKGGNYYLDVYLDSKENDNEHIYIKYTLRDLLKLTTGLSNFSGLHLSNKGKDDYISVIELDILKAFDVVKDMDENQFIDFINNMSEEERDTLQLDTILAPIMLMTFGNGLNLKETYDDYCSITEDENRISLDNFKKAYIDATVSSSLLFGNRYFE